MGFLLIPNECSLFLGRSNEYCDTHRLLLPNIAFPQTYEMLLGHVQTFQYDASSWDTV